MDGDGDGDGNGNGNGTAAAAAAAAAVPHFGVDPCAAATAESAEAAETRETAVVLWKFANPYLDTREAATREMTIGGRLVVIHQDTTAEIDVTQNTGCLLWSAAFVLARFLEGLVLRRPNTLAGKRCLELGSGTGLCGIAARLLGARETTLTDLGDMLPLLTRNADLARAAEGAAELGGLTVAQLEWTGSVDHIGPPFDVVLCSEVVYDEAFHHPLLQCLQAVTAPGSTVYMSYKDRALGERVWGCRLANTGLFKVREVPQAALEPDFRDVGIHVLLLTRLAAQTQPESERWSTGTPQTGT